MVKLSTAVDPVSIPQKINVVVSLLAMVSVCGLLRFVSHAEAWLFRILGAVAFSYLNNTLFSLLHEAVHGVFHSNVKVNTFWGRWLAAFFPTSFTLQRYFHLGHHRRNRSPAERFDYIAPGENAFLKQVQWYGILTGLYWLLPPLSCLIFLVTPRFFSSKVFRAENSSWSRQTGAEAMVEEIGDLPAWRIRSEIVFAIVFHSALFWMLNLTVAGWLLCYAAFAINWSSLQYADHAWSSLDTMKGAWNLKVNPVVRWVFLNYHHHLAHHENPRIPWIHLGRFVRPDETRPSFARIYLSMWRGPRPLPTDAWLR